MPFRAADRIDNTQEKNNLLNNIIIVFSNKRFSCVSLIINVNPRFKRLKMRLTTGIIITLGLVLATGCAARNRDIIIDPTGVRMDQYQADLAQCQRISMQVEQKAGGGAVGGAVIGGLIGSAVGNSKTAKKGATVGAITGTARGARATKRERQKVVKNCLRQRGYVVLN
jgi:outer membrane lipoprotein SlyB